MIEKKKVWAVTRDLKIVEKIAIVEDGKVIATKTNDDGTYECWHYDIYSYRESEEQAKKWIENIKEEIRDLAPAVKKGIHKLDQYGSICNDLGIEKEDYLGSYANRPYSYLDKYENEEKYANKLETFVKSRMLEIDGFMMPQENVRNIDWYGWEDAEEYEPDQWKAVVNTKSGEHYSTSCEEDVRLIWTVFGKCTGAWFIDNDIDYDKSNDDEE